MAGFFYLIFSRIFHIVACLVTLFLFIAQYYSVVWIRIYCMDIPHLFVHQLMNFWVVSTFWPILYNAAVKMYSFCVDICFHLSKIYIPGVELLDHMVTVLNFIRNCQTVFQTGSTVFHSWQ